MCHAINFSYADKENFEHSLRVEALGRLKSLYAKGIPSRLDLSWWKRRRRGRRKSTRMDLVMGKKKKGRQKEAPVKEERKKLGYFVPTSVLTLNTLVPC